MRRPDLCSDAGGCSIGPDTILRGCSRGSKKERQLDIFAVVGCGGVLGDSDPDLRACRPLSSVWGRVRGQLQKHRKGRCRGRCNRFQLRRLIVRLERQAKEGRWSSCNLCVVFLNRQGPPFLHFDFRTPPPSKGQYLLEV
jgi:hypothetical protein